MKLFLLGASAVIIPALFGSFNWLSLLGCTLMAGVVVARFIREAK